MRDGFLKAALLAGVIAFSVPAAVHAQTDDASQNNGQPTATGPDASPTTAGTDAAAAPDESTDGCPKGALGTDESTAGTTGTTEGTDADATNCAENEPSDQPAATDEGDDGQSEGGDGQPEGGAGGTEEQGSDDAGTNTGG